MELSSSVAKCSRCEVLPPRSAGAGKLYLWFPLGHSYAKVIPYLMQLETRYDLISDDHCVVISLTERDRDEVLTGMGELLGPEERQDTKALFMLGDRPPTLGDYANVTTLDQFLSASEANWLIDMLEGGRFTSHFQPIVSAADPSRIVGQEALFRGFEADGTPISPARIFDQGRRANLLFQLDLQARRSAIREAARHQLDTPIFINFNPASIYDPAFCLRSTMRAIDEAGFDHGRIVFEVVESDSVAQPQQLAKILDFYRSMGFKVALDDLGAGYGSLNLLHMLKPDIVKLDMALVRDVDREPYKATMTAKILELARELGIQTIAEGIETAGECDWLRAHGADYLQGYLFARPSSPPVRSLALAAS